MLKFLVVSLIAVQIDLIKCSLDSAACGIINEPSSLIVNGKNASKGIFPWTAAVFYSYRRRFEYWNSGTLLSNKHILVPGSSIGHRDRNNNFIFIAIERVRAYLGVTVLDGESAVDALLTSEASRIAVHPDLSDGVPRASDIGIIELKTSITFNEFISPVCLPDDSFIVEEFVGKIAFGVGWGRDANGKFTMHRKYAAMPITTKEVCESFWIKQLNSSVNSKYFCAGGSGKETACVRDDPLYIKINDHWYLIGLIAAFHLHNKTCVASKPLLYEDIGKYSSWIRNQIMS